MADDQDKTSELYPIAVLIDELKVSSSAGDHFIFTMDIDTYCNSTMTFSYD